MYPGNLQESKNGNYMITSNIYILHTNKYILCSGVMSKTNSMVSLNELVQCKPDKVLPHKTQVSNRAICLSVDLTESFLSLASVSIFLELWFCTLTHPIQIHPETVICALPKIQPLVPQPHFRRMLPSPPFSHCWGCGCCEPFIVNQLGWPAQRLNL